MTILEQLRAKLPPNHPCTDTALITLSTIEQNEGAQVSPTKLYLSLLSLLTQPKPSESYFLLVLNVLPLIPRPIFEQTSQNIVSVSSKSERYHILLLG